MAPRAMLQSLLEEITPHVYFQPPANVQMKYPCIVYSRDSADTKFAGNVPYSYTKRYQLTVIDQDPDSEIPDKVAMLTRCTFDRAYVAENLNHDVFSIFF